VPARRARTDAIVVHHSPSREDTFLSIRRAHRKVGMLDIGYHFVIEAGGRVEDGRPVDVCGNHVPGRNDTTVGVCVVGPAALMSTGQDASLERLLRELAQRYPAATVFYAE
jgi:N-acetyl-anhydromuramyl-L-alanine amidase AmpD